MLAGIQEDVAKRVVHLFRGWKEAVMISLGEDSPGAARDAIDGPSESRPDRFHPATERVLIARFHDEMRVVALQRVLHEPKSRPLAPGREAALDFAHDARVPE
jgi:hypothetical protein